MGSITVNLTAQQEMFVEQVKEKEGFPNRSAVIRAFVEEALERRALSGESK